MTTTTVRSQIFNDDRELLARIAVKGKLSLRHFQDPKPDSYTSGHSSWLEQQMKEAAADRQRLQNLRQADLVTDTTKDGEAAVTLTDAGVSEAERLRAERDARLAEVVDQAAPRWTGLAETITKLDQAWQHIRTCPATDLAAALVTLAAVQRSASTAADIWSRSLTDLRDLREGTLPQYRTWPAFGLGHDANTTAMIERAADLAGRDIASWIADHWPQSHGTDSGLGQKLTGLIGWQCEHLSATLAARTTTTEADATVELSPAAGRRGAVWTWRLVAGIAIVIAILATITALIQ